MNNRIKGTVAEIAATQYLTENGFSILECNYSSSKNFQGGEIDIIAKRGGRIHFIEVKSRTTDKFGTGRESVTAYKQKTIRRMAIKWLVTRGLWDVVPVSLDIIEINNGIIEYYENAF